MEIQLERSFGYYLVITDSNIKIEEDIERREYPKGEDGKTNFKAAPKRDIKTEVIDQFVRVLDDIIYYREAEYSGSVDLIKQLFDKLPSSIAIPLADELSKTYYADED